MNKLTSTEEDSGRPSRSQEGGWKDPGMGAKPNKSPYRRESTLDLEEEKELNEWLSKFDQQYSEEGTKVVKTSAGRGASSAASSSGGRGGLGSSPLPSLDGLLGEDDDLDALFGGRAAGSGRTGGEVGWMASRGAG